MKRTILYVSLLLVGACQEQARCETFPTQPQQFESAFYMLRASKLDEASLRLARRNIEYCYSKAPFEDPRYRIIFDSVKMDEDGKSILVYEFHGINDVRVGFKIDKNADVIAAYLASSM